MASITRTLSCGDDRPGRCVGDYHVIEPGHIDPLAGEVQGLHLARVSLTVGVLIEPQIKIVTKV